MKSGTIRALYMSGEAKAQAFKARLPKPNKEQAAKSNCFLLQFKPRICSAAFFVYLLIGLNPLLGLILCQRCGEMFFLTVLL